VQAPIYKLMRVHNIYHTLTTQ